MDLTDLRQAREAAAWLLLTAAVILLGIGIWFLVGLPGSGDGPTIADHVEAASANIVGIDFTLLPVAAVLLAALGRPAGSVRQIALLAVIIQLIALALGVIGWLLGIAGASAWFTIADVSNLLVAAAGLIVTRAVLRSHSPTLRG
jgi:hypothetical protein